MRHNDANTARRGGCWARYCAGPPVSPVLTLLDFAARYSPYFVRKAIDFSGLIPAYMAGKID
jgi:hypothetical protein